MRRADTRQGLELFQRALRLAPRDRANFLSRLDEGLRAVVESFLHADAVSGTDRLDELTARDEERRRELPLVAGTVLGEGRFQLVEEIGHGGMGVVWRARQLRLDRDVAIKFVLRSLAAGGSIEQGRELDVLREVSSPYLPQVHDIGEWETRDRERHAWIAMQFVGDERGPARDIRRHARDAGLDARARLELFARCLDGVDHLHQAGIVHCDLKANNILIAADGTPKIVDFGIAVRTDLADEGDLEVLGRTGTLPYLAPERANESPPAPGWDVFSMGVLLDELLRDLESNGDRPRDLQAIVEVARHPDPARRYRSVAAFRRDLRAFLDGRPVAARDGGPFYVLAKTLKRRPAIALLLLPVLASLSWFAVWKVELEEEHRHLEEARRRESDERRQRIVERRRGALASLRELVPDFLRFAEQTVAESGTEHAIDDGEGRWKVVEASAVLESGDPLPSRPRYLDRPVREMPGLETIEPDTEEAIAQFVRARRHLDALATDFFRTDWDPLFLDTLVLLGDAALSFGRPLDTWKIHERALDEGLRRLTEEPSNLDLLAHVAICQDSLGYLSWSRGTPGEALEWFLRASEAGGELMTRAPDVASHGNNAARASLRAAMMHIALRNPEEASRLRDLTSERLARTSARHGPAWVDAQGAFIYDQLVHVNRALGHPQQALEVLRALEASVARTSRGARPGDDAFRDRLALDYLLATTLTELGREEEASPARTRALAHLAAWDEAGAPRDPLVEEVRQRLAR